MIISELEPPFLGEACDIWGVPAAPAIEAQAVFSSIPTLIVAGSADTATPPQWSRLAGETLDASTYVEFNGLSHGLLGNNECLNTITAAFIDDPAASVETSCVDSEPAVQYEMP